MFKDVNFELEPLYLAFGSNHYNNP
jgi:hypothetical protein